MQHILENFCWISEKIMHVKIGLADFHAIQMNLILYEYKLGHQTQVIPIKLTPLLTQR